MTYEDAIRDEVGVLIHAAVRDIAKRVAAEYMIPVRCIWDRHARDPRTVRARHCLACCCFDTLGLSYAECERAGVRRDIVLNRHRHDDPADVATSLRADTQGLWRMHVARARRASREAL